MINKKTSYIKAGIFLLLGLIFILVPSLVSKYIMIIIGASIIAYGLLTLLTAIKLENKAKINLSIIICVCGLLVILLAGFILSAIGIFIAIYCLISGFSTIGLAFKRQEMHLPYFFQLAKGAISLIISVIFFVLPKSAINIQIIVLGIYLIISAINQIHNALTASEKEYDFVNFYFHKDKKHDEEKINIKDDSVIDVESSVKESDNDNE